MKTTALLLRSLAFYLGWIPVTIVMASLFPVLFLFMTRGGRHRFVRLWVGFLMFWLRLCCGVRHQVSGRENLPAPGSGPPAVVLANHQSGWETFLLYRLIYPVAPILKRELLYIPLFGWGLWLQGAIAIDRGSPLEAGKTLLRDGAKRIKQGYSILVFPEGTRSPPGRMRRFSRGGAKLAVEADAPIILVAHNSGTCWPKKGLIKHPGLISVAISPPIPTAGREPSDLTKQAEDWIRAAIDGFNG